MRGIPVQVIRYRLLRMIIFCYGRGMFFGWGVGGRSGWVEVVDGSSWSREGGLYVQRGGELGEGVGVDEAGF